MVSALRNYCLKLCWGYVNDAAGINIIHIRKLILMSVTKTFKGKGLKRSAKKATLNIKSTCQIYSTASSVLGKTLPKIRCFPLERFYRMKVL
jgi:hypothetical protein